MTEKGRKKRMFIQMADVMRGNDDDGDDVV